MRTDRALLLVLGVCAALVPFRARTDGCFMPREDDWRRRREQSLILEPDQKALIYFENGREQLIISPNYAGNANDFAWVVPVPARPKVEILKGAPFHELARLVSPPPPAIYLERSRSKASGGLSEAVTVLERKTVGDYDVSVLAATDAGALMRWLSENRYHLPPKAEAPMRAYVAEGWTFVASKIRLHDTARGLKSGTLTPLKLTFASAHPMYPMRLTAASALPFTVLLYIAEPLARDRGPLVPISQPTTTFTRSISPYAVSDLAPGDRAAYPTLAPFSQRGLRVSWLRQEIRPDQCDRDYVWAHQARPGTR